MKMNYKVILKCRYEWDKKEFSYNFADILKFKMESFVIDKWSIILFEVRE